MYNGTLISSATIFDKIYRDFNIDYAVNYYDCLEWIGEGLRHLKIPAYYVDKVTDGNKDLNHQDFINIENGRGKLPCDLFSITQVACAQAHSKLPTVRSYITGISYCDINTGESCSTGDGTDLCNALSCSETACNTCSTCSSCNDCDCNPEACYYSFVPMKWSTNTFYKSYHGTDLDFLSHSQLTYTVNNNYIFTSFNSGKVAMAYKAVPTDAEGLPMIPDQQSVIDYITWFVGNKLMFQMWMVGKIADKVYEEFKGYMQLFYMKAKNEGKMPKSLDEWDSYKSQRLRTIPNMLDHNSFYKHLSTEQEIWRHPRMLSMFGAGSRMVY